MVREVARMEGGNAGTEGTGVVEEGEGEVVARIHQLASNGDGLGRVQGSGAVVVVPFTLPEEVVACRVYRHMGSYSLADLLHVTQPSPSRMAAACKYFGRCSGCQLQHMPYPAQLLFKRSVVVDALSVLRDKPAPEETVRSPATYAYRTKITPHFDLPRRVQERTLPAIGFQEKGRRRTMDIEECPIATPALNLGLTEERKRVAQRLESFKRGATLLLRESTTQGEKECITDSKAIVREEINNLTFHFPAGSFFQNNSSVLPRLVEHIRACLHPPTPNLVDAYCGSGLFSVACAPLFTHVYGVEISQESVTFAEQNAKANACTNLRFTVGDAGDIFGDLPCGGDDSSVIIDPPRKGCSEPFLQQLLHFRPRKIVYVSCNVRSQARDLAYMETQGGWRIERVTPFDLFPQTAHVESVAVLTRSMYI